MKKVLWLLEKYGSCDINRLQPILITISSRHITAISGYRVSNIKRSEKTDNKYQVAIEKNMSEKQQDETEQQKV